jgi:hypothetical protein
MTKLDNAGRETVAGGSDVRNALLLAVVAVGVGAAAVAVVDEAGGGHPEGLHTWHAKNAERVST